MKKNFFRENRTVKGTAARARPDPVLAQNSPKWGSHTKNDNILFFPYTIWNIFGNYIFFIKINILEDMDQNIDFGPKTAAILDFGSWGT